jgi:ATP-dependent Clp protease ATP-binding subunit ClpC
VVFEGFTPEACEAIDLALQQAKELDCPYVGAEHILLGLLLERSGVAAQVLNLLGVTLLDVRDRFANKELWPPDVPERGPFVRLGKRVLDLPFAPRAKRALEMAVREALTLGSASIETEHILLGLVRDTESPATRILIKLDAQLPHPEPVRRDREFDLEIRNAVIRRLSETQEPSAH